jgi:ComF family protein
MKNLFTGTCILCGLPSHRKQDLCKACEADLPWQNNNTTVIFHYQEPIDRLITGLKFANKLIYAKILGELMATKLKKHYQNKKLPELIIPIPLHKQRLRERGYNQALELARPIAKQLKIPLDFNSCIRTKNTAAQTLIPAKQRAQNLKNAFIINKKISAKYIAIIDDVTTTGNTINELSRILYQANINKVDIWCCAKTDP